MICKYLTTFIDQLEIIGDTYLDKANRKKNNLILTKQIEKNQSYFDKANIEKLHFF